MRHIKLLFAIICYATGFGTIIYYADFFTGFIVPKSINSGNPSSFASALLTDIGLLFLFGLQHTIMARKHFKVWFESFFPQSLTRSFYILFSSIGLGMLIVFWQPIPLVIYDFEGTPAGTILLVLYYTGWATGLLSTFEIDHFELFGVKQALNPSKKETDELKKSFFYRVVRHPIYVGWILIHWMTPQLTVGHLLLATGITVYIYVALMYEERDLIGQFGQQYLDYKKTTPQLNPLLYPLKKHQGAMKGARIAGLIVLIVLGIFAFKFFKWIGHEMSLMKSDDPHIWEDEIAMLSQKNGALKEDTSSVLFVGSSSFRFWETMEEDLAPINVINNGFGGAKLPDVLHFKDQLIYQYNPGKIVFFLGSNDISGNKNDKSPDELYTIYTKLATDIHQKLPNCHIYILPITPTLARWDVWPEIKKANDIIKHHSKNRDWITFIDLENAFLSSENEPIWEYYKWDGTHLNRKGYKVWAKAIKETISGNGSKLVTRRIQ